MKDVKVPVLFQTVKELNISDTRFSKVKIWLMHLGENMNGTSFSKEAVFNAIPTLSYTPIMGAIESGDFKGHEVSIEVEDDEVKFKKLTQAYGVIPEDNNAQFEDRVGDDGVTRTYLTVDGLLWNKWEEAINVLNSKDGKTGQSMEIVVDEYSESPDNFEIMSIDKFKFDGACLLGDDVKPAMINAGVEYSLSDKIDKTIKEKLAVYSTIEEGGNKVTEKDKEYENKEQEETEAKETEKISEEEPSDENTENKGEDTEETKSDSEGKETEPKAPEENPEDEDNNPDDGETEKQPEEEEKVVVKETTVANARKEIDEHEELRQPNIERIVVGENVYSVEQAVEMIKELQQLKQTLHEFAVDDLFDKYSSDLSDEEMQTLKENAYSKNIEELETLIFAAIGRSKYSKAQVNEKPGLNFSAVSIDTNEATSQKAYNGIIEKYL